MKNIVIFVVIINVITCYSQDIKLKFSGLTTVKRGTKIADAGIIEKNIYEIQYSDAKRRTMSISVFDDSNLQLITNRLFKNTTCKEDDCIDKHFSYNKTLFLKQSPIMFFSTFEKSTNNKLLFAQKINLHGKFVGKFLLVDKIKVDKKKEGSFYVWASEDSSKFMIINSPPYEKYAGEKFDFKVYDESLTNLHNFGCVLPYKDKNFELVDYYLTKDNKILILAKIDIEKDDKVRGQAPYYYSILTIDPNDQSVVEYKVRLASKNIEDISLKIDNLNAKIICTGFYSDIKPNAYTGYDIDGFFYMRIDQKSKEVEKSSTKKIDPEIIADMSNRRRNRSKNDGISSNFKIMNLIANKDGSTTLVAEERYYQAVTTQTCTQNGCTSRTDYHYYRNSIFVVRIDKEGQVGSFVNIPKYQHSVNDNGLFSSFICFEKGERLIFIFNDNPKNLSPNIKTQKDVNPMVKIRKTYLVAVELNKDGSYTKKMIHDNMKKKILILPEQGKKLEDGKYIAPTWVLPRGGGCSCFTYLFTKQKMGIVRVEL